MPSNAHSRPKAAAFGSLDVNAHQDLMLYEGYLRRLVASLMNLRGNQYLPSYLRGAVARLILIEFGEGRVNQIGFYQTAASEFGTGFAVRQEIRKLERLELVILSDDPADKRGALVWPTRRLVSWASDDMPRMPKA
jgi:hypothetical protein